MQSQQHEIRRLKEENTNMLYSTEEIQRAHDHLAETAASEAKLSQSKIEILQQQVQPFIYVIIVSLLDCESE